MKLKYIAISTLALAMLALSVIPALANGPKVGFGELYYDGRVVRTVVPPAANPKSGKDNFYAVPGQRAVAAVAPGDKDYHGGKWAVHEVSWNVEPYELTSEDAVLNAEKYSHVTITRMPKADFKCPIQP
jgi:hypothetical protein